MEMSKAVLKGERDSSNIVIARRLIATVRNLDEGVCRAVLTM